MTIPELAPVMMTVLPFMLVEQRQTPRVIQANRRRPMTRIRSKTPSTTQHSSSHDITLLQQHHNYFLSKTWRSEVQVTRSKVIAVLWKEGYSLKKTFSIALQIISCSFLVLNIMKRLRLHQQAQRVKCIKSCPPPMLNNLLLQQVTEWEHHIPLAYTQFVNQEFYDQAAKFLTCDRSKERHSGHSPD